MWQDDISAAVEALFAEAATQGRETFPVADGYREIWVPPLKLKVCPRCKALHESRRYCSRRCSALDARARYRRRHPDRIKAARAAAKERHDIAAE